jgi:hypothetical protein
LAQCFETAIQALLLINERISNQGLSLAEFDSMENELQKKTLGSLLKEMRSLVEIEQSA